MSFTGSAQIRIPTGGLNWPTIWANLENPYHRPELVAHDLGQPKAICVQRWVHQPAVAPSTAAVAAAATQ